MHFVQYFQANVKDFPETFQIKELTLLSCCVFKCHIQLREVARRWDIRVSSSRVHSTLKLFCLFRAISPSFTRLSAKQALSEPLQICLLSLKRFARSCGSYYAEVALHGSLGLGYTVLSGVLIPRSFLLIILQIIRCFCSGPVRIITMSSDQGHCDRLRWLLTTFSNLIQVPEMGMALGLLLRLPVCNETAQYAGH